MTETQVVKLAARGFKVIRADEYSGVIREWNGAGWNTIQRFRAGDRMKRNLRREMSKKLRDPLTVRG